MSWLCNIFDLFSSLWIRIPNTDPDPEDPWILIRIRNTEKYTSIIISFVQISSLCAKTKVNFRAGRTPWWRIFARKFWSSRPDQLTRAEESSCTTFPPFHRLCFPAWLNAHFREYCIIRFPSILGPLTLTSASQVFIFPHPFTHILSQFTLLYKMYIF